MTNRPLLLGALLLATARAAPLGQPEAAAALLPPGFDEVLPASAKERLFQLHANPELSFEERRDAIERVFDELPPETLARVPLAPGLQRLPAEYRDRFRALQMDRTLSGAQRHDRLQALVAALPEALRALVRGPPAAAAFPALPPPGFERIVGATVFAQLARVHADADLSAAEKKAAIDRLMRQVPRSQLDALPLPPGFDRLPHAERQRARAIFTDFELGWDQRHAALVQFVRQLPAEQRRLLRPPLAPALARLPAEPRERLERLLDDLDLAPAERLGRVQRLLNELPAPLRASLPPHLLAPPPQP